MVMPYQMLQDAARGSSPLLFASSGSFKDEQFQPASIDLRLGKEIHALSATFVPRPEQPVS